MEDEAEGVEAEEEKMAQSVGSKLFLKITHFATSNPPGITHT